MGVSIMAFYPFPERIQKVWASAPSLSGNFGLWYNKYVPLQEGSLKPADDRDKKDDRNKDPRAVEYYAKRYGLMMGKSTAASLLKQKHTAFDDYCHSFPAEKYDVIALRAELISPLVTGIGESHPHEVSMVFDHNLGIPYIPASGVKGIVRFAHTLSLWKSGLVQALPEKLVEQDKETKKIIAFDDDNWEEISLPFGNQKHRGTVFFLDAYPEDVPALRLDIMNPHYGDYYANKEGKIPPADYLSPNPIKFLTVSPGAVFIFRAVVIKEGSLLDKVRSAFVRALVEEGVGAKTALGYGRFRLQEPAPARPTVEKTEQKEIPVSLLDKLIQEIGKIAPHDAGRLGSIIEKALKELASEEDKRRFAHAVKEHMGKQFKGSKAKVRLEKYLNAQ